MQAGSRGLLPAAAVVLLPIATVDTGLRRKRFPRQPRLAATFLVEQVEGAIERQCLLAPHPVAKQDVARAVRRVGCGREQNGLLGIGVTARAAVRQEACSLERQAQAVEGYGRWDNRRVGKGRGSSMR